MADRTELLTALEDARNALWSTYTVINKFRDPNARTRGTWERIPNYFRFELEDIARWSRKYAAAADMAIAHARQAED